MFSKHFQFKKFLGRAEACASLSGHCCLSCHLEEKLLETSLCNYLCEVFLIWKTDPEHSYTLTLINLWALSISIFSKSLWSPLLFSSFSWACLLCFSMAFCNSDLLLRIFMPLERKSIKSQKGNLFITFCCSTWSQCWYFWKWEKIGKGWLSSVAESGQPHPSLYSYVTLWL